MGGCLEGYRVLDLGRYISGPFCAALLGELGGDIVRVEPPEGSDDRYVMPIGDGPSGGGALHHHVNIGKRSLALDIGKVAARTVLERLIASADVLIANMPPAALAKLGLDYETLVTIRPDIILVTINAYGPSGPFANDVGFDGTGQALSGAMSLTGTVEQPFRSAVSYVDYSTAISAALGVVAALLNRTRTGRGEHVQCSLLATALTMTNPMLIEEWAGARRRTASGNRSPIAAPSDLFRTKDGWIMIQVIGQPMFRRWADLVGKPELADDSRYASDQQRAEHGEELSGITAAWCAGKSNAECLSSLRADRIPATPLLTPAEALLAPEMVLGRLLRTVSTRDGRNVPIVAPVCQVGDPCADVARGAPMLGEHTDEILQELGFDSLAIADLRRKDVVGRRPLIDPSP